MEDESLRAGLVFWTQCAGFVSNLFRFDFASAMAGYLCCFQSWSWRLQLPCCGRELIAGYGLHVPDICVVPLVADLGKHLKSIRNIEIAD